MSPLYDWPLSVFLLTKVNASSCSASLSINLENLRTNNNTFKLCLGLLGSATVVNP